MKYYFNKFAWPIFALRTILYSALVDFVALTYVYKKCTNPIYLTKTIDQAIRAQGANPQDISTQDFEAFYHLIANLVLGVVILAGVVHGVIYLCYFFKKKFAVRYMKVLAISGLICVPLGTLGPALFGNTELIMYSFLTLLYLHNTFALKYRDELNPQQEK